MFDGSRIVRNHRNFIFSVIQNFKFITLKYFGTVLLRILLCFVILLILVLIIHILSHSWKCINNNLIKMASSRCSSNLNNLNSFAYVYSKELENESNKLPTLLNRASIVQDLISSYNLLTKMEVINSEKASEEDLKQFHSSSYVEFLKKVNNCDNLEEYDEEQLEYGLGYDNPILEGMYNFVQTIAGSSLTAASALISKKYNYVINWFGGWHHAQRDGAEGFCYVNDIVLAIQKLSYEFKKVLYIDLDIHHGDGVQNAFEYSNKILTLSFHKYTSGFYPGTGDITDIGLGNGRYFSLNVPLKYGIGHKNYLKLFKEIFPEVLESFDPDAIVVQCGADGLNGDPLGQSNLTLETIGECIQDIVLAIRPTIFLGGGGYNFCNTARLWTYLTSIIIDCNIPDPIPDESQYFTMYLPTFELHIQAGLQMDCNTVEEINKIIEDVKYYCSHIAVRLRAIKS